MQPEHRQQAAALPQRLTSPLWPTPLHSSVLSFIAAASSSRGIPVCFLPKMPKQNFGRGTERSQPTLSPCSLSSHFKKQKRKTSFLCRCPDMGVIRFHSCWWPDKEHTRQFFPNSTCASHQNNREPCSQRSLCVRDFQVPPLQGLNSTSPSFKKHNLKEEQSLLLQIRHLKIQIKSNWQ